MKILPPSGKELTCGIRRGLEQGRHQYRFVRAGLEQLFRRRIDTISAGDGELDCSDLIGIFVTAEILIVLREISAARSSDQSGGDLLLYGSGFPSGEAGIEDIRHAGTEIRTQGAVVIGNIRQDFISSGSIWLWEMRDQTGQPVGFHRQCGRGEWLPVPVSGETVDVVAVKKDRSIIVVIDEIAAKTVLP